MRPGAWLIGCSLLLLAAGCGGGDQPRVYKNSDFGFAVNYPAGYLAKPIKWVKEENGRLYKVTVDCPKAPFSQTLIKSMAEQAGVKKKDFYRIFKQL